MARAIAQKPAPVKFNFARFVIQNAPKFGLDPRAVLAIAIHESGGRVLAIGDQGTSFGPFQLHRGGALPAGKNLAWAASPQGILYAMRQMANSGARGLTGRAAIEAISRNFERPSNPAGEIADAMTHYGGIQVPTSEPAGPTPNIGSPPAGPQRGLQGPLQASQLEPTPIIAQNIGPLKAPTGKALAQLPMLGPVQQVQISLPKAMPVRTIQGRTKDGSQMPPIQVQHDVNAKPDGRTTEILDLARHYLGTKYVFGGASPRTGFDCSGFVQWLYGQVGIKLPRTTFEQVKVGTPVGMKDLQPGDILFFNTENDPRGPSHEALYIGNGKFIQAPHTGDVVKISNINDPYYQKTFVTARRIR